LFCNSLNYTMTKHFCKGQKYQQMYVFVCGYEILLYCLPF